MDTAAEILSLVREGQTNRSVAVTQMNLHSSRSHSLVVIRVKQYDSHAEKTIIGKLHLVDLAGSEKVCRAMYNITPVLVRLVVRVV